MIRSSDLIVSVSLDTLNRVVWVVVELIKHHLIHLVVHWHWLLTWEQTFRTLVLLLLEPRMASNVIYAITLLWVCVQDL
jgi:hypothetical protein